MKTTTFILISILLFFISCQKLDLYNPFDPNCPKDIWTPTDFRAVQEENSVKLSWNQSVNPVSGFRIEKKVDNGQTISLPDQSKGTNQFTDNNLTGGGGKVHVYSLTAFAGENTSNTVTTQITPILTADIITSSVNNITSNSVTSGGTVNSDGGAEISARGVCWSTSQNPTTADNKTSNGTGTGNFSSSITGLTPGVTYYIRAYATNSSGTAYGNQVTTTTAAILPTINTATISAITSTTAASGGNITDNGGVTITARGVCWSISQNPTIADSKTTDGTGSGSFSSSITGLTPGATYYIRAYATNSIGTAYGNQVTTSTTAILPTISTIAISAVTSTTATSGGNITSDGGKAIAARGVCWSLNQNPSIADSKTTDGSGTGSFSSSITGLMPGATYYIRAYAINSIGTAYGDQVTTTTTAVLPTITTTAISAITSTSAASGGNITSDGGAAITARGACWSTSQNPTTVNSKTTDGTGTGNFASSITGLTPGTIYYIRAYATNSAGTNYGDQLTLTTTATLPTLTTTALSAITATTATGGGNITGDGGAAVTVRGVCWSASQNPTIADNKTTDGTGTGSFTSSITGLTSGTTYYIRAYATNSTGTAYGNQITLTTGLPTLTTTALSAITSTTATSGGNITDDGGTAITSRGVCWSTNQNPTIAANKTTDGTGTGSFTSSITGLSSGTTYYIRAYATTSIGTAYGNQITLTTGLPTLTTTALSAITSTTVTSGGNITDDGGTAITSRGVCWSMNQNPTTADSKTNDGSGKGSFTSSITGLTPGTTYYFRAYAVSSIGTAYGNQLTTTTAPGLPTLTTVALSAITLTTATGGGNISNDGEAVVTSRGVCWSTSLNPTIANSKTIDGSGSGTFTSSITGLTPGTTYYVRAYATNSVGTAYGDGLDFTTSLNTAPAIPIITSITPGYQTVTINWNTVSGAAGYNIYWSTDPGVSKTNYTGKLTSNGNNATSFQHVGLTGGTMYYYVVTAQNVFESSESKVAMATPPLLLQTNNITTQGEKKYFQVTVSSGQNLLVTLGLASGYQKDLDLYVKFGSLPTNTDYDAKSVTGADEAVQITDTKSGTYYIMVYVSSLLWSSNFTITASTSANVLTLGTTADGIISYAGDKQFYQITVPSGQNLFVTLGLASGYQKDLNLYVKFGSIPTTTDNDFKSETQADEAISILNTQAGTYYIMVYAASFLSGQSDSNFTITTFN